MLLNKGHHLQKKHAPGFLTNNAKLLLLLLFGQLKRIHGKKKESGVYLLIFTPVFRDQGNNLRGDVGTKTWRKMFATLTMGKTPDEGGIKTQLRQSSSSYFLKHFLSRAFSSQLWKRHLMVIRFDNKQKNSDVKSSHQAGRSWSSPLFLDPVKSYNYLTSDKIPPQLYTCWNRSIVWSNYVL